MGRNIDTYYLEALDGDDFEKLCQIIFNNLNYGEVVKTQTGPDAGKDLIIQNKNDKIFVECKHHLNKTIGRPTIQKLHSAVISEGAKRGILVTTGIFSQEAINYAKKIDPPIELIDKNLLFDLASRAGVSLETKLGKGKVYTYPISDDALIKSNLSHNIERKLISRPSQIEDSIKINQRKIFLKPMYLIDYNIDAEFITNVGLIHSENDYGTFFLNGANGKILEEEIADHFNGIPYNNLVLENTKNVKTMQFKLLSGRVKGSAISHIIKKHTTSQTYTGRNNVTYTKNCVPKKKDIFLSNISQVYIPENEIYFDLKGKKRFFKIADNGTMNFYIYEDNVSNCEICGRLIGKMGIICNECGTISHNKRLFFSHGFYCKTCGKSLCRSCTSYYTKFLFFKTPLCKDCAKILMEDGKVVKKFKPIRK